MQNQTDISIQTFVFFSWLVNVASSDPVAMIVTRHLTSFSTLFFVSLCSSDIKVYSLHHL